MLFQNETPLLAARRHVYRHVTDATWRARYEEALARPDEQREREAAAAQEAARARAAQAQAARARIRVPGVGLLAQLELRAAQVTPRTHLLGMMAVLDGR